MDIEIFPHRILGADTTEKLLNKIESMDTVKRTVIQGPRLPPQDAVDIKYGDRREIVVNGENVELKVQTGRIFVELIDEEAVGDIEEICTNELPFGFSINTNKSQYIRKQKTVSDGMKYGHNTDIPEDLIGITDQHTKFDDAVSMIRRDDAE